LAGPAYVMPRMRLMSLPQLDPEKTPPAAPATPLFNRASKMYMDIE